jgi:membrane-bound lytic murein transglycosylase A
MEDRIEFRKSEKKISVQRTDFKSVKGWDRDDPAQALAAFEKSCVKIQAEGDFVGSSQIVISADWMRDACAAIPGRKTAESARAYFEQWFDPYAVAAISGASRGTITAYYEAEVEGDLKPDCDYRVPIYGKPFDLPQDGSEYLSRREIENGGIRTRAPVLFWAKSPAEVHILHIQGSGRVKTRDGKRYRVGYAANNGRKFTGIGGILKARGIDVGGTYSMLNVKKWLDTHPTEAKKLMHQNERFIFFRDIDGDGPVGAMGVPLTSGRSVAVDPDFIPLGLPLFLETTDPDNEKIERLVVAQDVGAAIKGAVRADLFWGAGERAFTKAGRMKSDGGYFIFLPKDGKNFAVKK